MNHARAYAQLMNRLQQRPSYQDGGFEPQGDDQGEVIPAGGYSDLFERGMNALRNGRTSQPPSYSRPAPAPQPPQQQRAPVQSPPNGQNGYRVDLPQFFAEPFTLPNERGVNDFFDWYGYKPQSPSERGYNPPGMPEDNGGNAYIEKNPHGPQYGGWIVHEFKDMGSPNQSDKRDWSEHGFNLWSNDHSGKIYQHKDGRRRISIGPDGLRYLEAFGKGPGHWDSVREY